MHKHVEIIIEKQFGLAIRNINQTFTTRAKTQTPKIAKVKVPKHRELSVRSTFDSQNKECTKEHNHDRPQRV